jgi:3-hydroxy-9,10-secoandrosta-1,3,5(10)-triene-9,17-dione monooxygenase
MTGSTDPVDRPPAASGGAQDAAADDPVEQFLPSPPGRLHVSPLLEAIEAQAVRADETRLVDRSVIDAIRGSDLMRLSASAELGGLECSMYHIGRELEAVAARDPSLAWTLWNHLCVFHLFAGALGPDHLDFLRSIVEAGQWVSFPAGAGSSVHGVLDGNEAVLNGTGTFSTGAQYGDWCGVVFAVTEDGRPVRPLDLRFTLVANDNAGVKIDPTWDGSGLRASATDDVHYADVRVPLARCCAWFGANRAESLRTVPVINHRYREDWVGISDLWLGWMALGVVKRTLQEMTADARHRRVIMGAKMVERPTVQLNVGRALSLTAAAWAAIGEVCHEVDRRIEDGRVPGTADYFRQQAVVTMAVDQLSGAMDLLARSQGGNGLREGTPFERRSRDFRAMPLHINAHQDRITHQVGRLALGIDLEPF